jgi:hypothetical protein
MEEPNGDVLTEEHRLSTEKTKAGIEQLEHDIKETVKSIVLDEWDPENQEIFDQLSELVSKSQSLKQEVRIKDLEISKLREMIADKRKHIKQSRLSLDTLRSTIRGLEEAVVICKQHARDLVILEQADRIAEGVERTKSGTRPIVMRGQTAGEKISNKFVPIGGYQGVYATRGGGKVADKGKQELSMPFLSASAQNWISSLRTSSKSPLRSEKHKPV